MDFIEIYPNVLTEKDCADICLTVDDILSREDPGNGTVLSNDKNRIDYNIFSGKYQSLVHHEEAIIAAVKHFWRKYNSKYETTNASFETIFHKGWKIQRSETGGGFFTWHFEQGETKTTNTRFAVWLIYLNTVEVGGKTEFLHQKLAVKPEVGTLVIWPAGYTHYHRAAPDLEGKKYIATGWFTYPN